MMPTLLADADMNLGIRGCTRCGRPERGSGVLPGRHPACQAGEPAERDHAGRAVEVQSGRVRPSGTEFTSHHLLCCLAAWRRGRETLAAGRAALGRASPRHLFYPGPRDHASSGLG